MKKDAFIDIDICHLCSMILFCIFAYQKKYLEFFMNDYLVGAFSFSFFSCFAYLLSLNMIFGIF